MKLPTTQHPASHGVLSVHCTNIALPRFRRPMLSRRFVTHTVPQNMADLADPADLAVN